MPGILYTHFEFVDAVACIVNSSNKSITLDLVLKHGVVWERVEDSMPNTRTQTSMHLSLTSHNLLARTYICVAELATWGVCPDALIKL